MSLRPYQAQAVIALWNYMRSKKGNGIICLPPGSGKSWCLAQIVKDAVGWGGKVIVAQHVRELISQNLEKLQKLAPEISFGVYSAGLGSHDTNYSCIFAGIQSAYRNAHEFGKVDLLVIDECHRLNPEDESSMYQKFISGLREQNPDLMCCGATATPYRLGGGPICSADNLFNSIVYDASIKELIRDKYLSPITTKGGREKPDLSKVHVRASEFIASELEQAMTEDVDKVALTCVEICQRTEDRKSCLVFCSGVAHAELVASILLELEPKTATLFGHTPYKERDEIVRAYRAGEIRYLVSVDTIGIGFDAPATDAVIMLRPSLSPGLIVQQAGRGMRLADGKKNMLLLDFSGNIERLGMIDNIQPPGKRGEKSGEAVVKRCPDCAELIAGGYAACPECGFKFPDRGSAKHGMKPYEGPILASSEEWYTVEDVWYQKHTKKDAPAGHPPTLRATYDCGLLKVSEWVCLEHKGFARAKATQWWIRRGAMPIPATVEEALERIKAGPWREPTEIKVGSEGKYLRILEAKGFKERVENEKVDAQDSAHRPIGERVHEDAFPRADEPQKELEFRTLGGGSDGYPPCDQEAASQNHAP